MTNWVYLYNTKSRPAMHFISLPGQSIIRDYCHVHLVTLLLSLKVITALLEFN